MNTITTLFTERGSTIITDTRIPIERGRVIITGSAVDDLLQVVQTGGVVGLLLAIIVGGGKRWWVFGWQFREMVKERDEWKRAALRGTDLADDAATTAAEGVRMFGEAIAAIKRKDRLDAGTDLVKRSSEDDQA